MNEDFLCAILIALVVVLILYIHSPPKEGLSTTEFGITSPYVASNIQLPTSYDQIPNSSQYMPPVIQPSRAHLRPYAMPTPRMQGRRGYESVYAGK